MEKKHTTETTGRKEMYLDQFLGIKKTLIEGISKAYQGYADITSAIKGIELFDPSFNYKKFADENDPDATPLHLCWDILCSHAAVALIMLSKAGKRAGLPNKITDARRFCGLPHRVRNNIASFKRIWAKHPSKSRS